MIGKNDRGSFIPINKKLLFGHKQQCPNGAFVDILYGQYLCQLLLDKAFNRQFRLPFGSADRNWHDSKGPGIVVKAFFYQFVNEAQQVIVRWRSDNTLVQNELPCVFLFVDFLHIICRNIVDFTAFNNGFYVKESYGNPF